MIRVKTKEEMVETLGASWTIGRSRPTQVIAWSGSMNKFFGKELSEDFGNTLDSYKFGPSPNTEKPCINIDDRMVGDKIVPHHGRDGWFLSYEHLVEEYEIDF
jgi:hypothetical protein